MRLPLAILVSGLVGVFAACGSTRPPAAELSPPSDASADSQHAVQVDASQDAGPLCSDPSDDMRGPAGETPCTCTVPLGAGLSITLPCGYSVCRGSSDQAAVCTRDGRLIYVPGSVSNCPYDNGDGGPGALPPCDAGAPPGPDAGDAGDAATTDGG